MKLITEATAEKLRGGFYTPEIIAEFILRWGINGNSNSDILEPSCGDGIFLKQILKNNLYYNSITAVELNEVEAEKADSIQLKNKQDENNLYCIYPNIHQLLSCSSPK